MASATIWNGQVREGNALVEYSFNDATETVELEILELPSASDLPVLGFDGAMTISFREVSGWLYAEAELDLAALIGDDPHALAGCPDSTCSGWTCSPLAGFRCTQHHWKGCDANGCYLDEWACTGILCDSGPLPDLPPFGMTIAPL
ncbi:hypothetical protein [Nannocystis exedens]|uniref:hypothetical protein n=1 Tax=Nannocystis exedens TaxID=54 RepID=UPI000BB9FE43|nr:hypothetical protein [Nannocystis exedens]